MTTANLKMMGIGITVMALLLSACADVNISGDWPAVDYTGAWWWPGKADVYVTRVITLDEPVEDRQRVRLEALSGSIVIKGVAGSGSIQLTADLLAGADTLEDAQAGLDQMDVIVTRLPEEICFQTDQPGSLAGRQYVVDYTLSVPEDIQVIVSQTNGHITIEDMANRVGIEAMNGDIQLQGIRGDVDAGVNNGSIDGTVILLPGGQIALSTVNGDIDLRVPTWTSAALSASSSTGPVNWDNLAIADAQATAHSLTGLLDTGDGVIDLETVNGSVFLSGF